MSHRGVLLATILGSGLVFIDGSVVNVILPELQREFRASALEIQWVVESYLLSLASLILIGGSLGDRFGRKRIFQIGTLIFVLSSLGCAFAQDLLTLTVFRLLQGVGGSMLTPGSLAIINSVFPKDERGEAIGAWSGFSAMATAIGPVLGGWLSDEFSWRWVFLINVPLGGAVLYFTKKYVPEQCSETGHESLDGVGVIVSTLAIGTLVWGLVQSSLRLVLCGVLLGGVFIFFEGKTKTPLIPLWFFKSRVFSLINVITFFLYGALGVVFYFLPFHLIQVQHFTAAEAGAANLPFIFIIFLSSRWTGKLYDRVGAKKPIAIGSLCTALSFLLLGFLPGLNATYWRDFFPGLVLFGGGMSLCIPPLTTAVLSAVPDVYSGISSGINNAITRIAGLIFIALMTVVMISLFEGYLEQLPLNTGLKLDLLRRSHELAGLTGYKEETQTLIKLSYLKSFQDIMVIAAGMALLSGFCCLFLPKRSGQNDSST